MKRARRVFAALFLFFGLAHPVGARTVEGIAAIVDGDPITLSEVRQFARRFSAVPRPGLPELDHTPEVLQLLIEERLVEREAEKIGISIEPSEVDRAINDLLQANSLTPEALETLLADQGLSLEYYRTEIRRELIKAKLIAREIQPRVFLSEEKIRTYYLENRDRFSAPPEVRISQIFLGGSGRRTEKKVADVKRRLDSGEDFTALAREFSEDPSGRQGGDLGFFTLEELRPELREVITALPPNQPSDPVSTPDGFHILMVTASRKGGRIPFEEVKNQVTEELFTREIERGFRSWIENVRLKAKIEIKLEPGVE